MPGEADPRRVSRRRVPERGVPGRRRAVRQAARVDHRPARRHARLPGADRRLLRARRSDDRRRAGAGRRVSAGEERALLRPARRRRVRRSRRARRASWARRACRSPATCASASRASTPTRGSGKCLAAAGLPPRVARTRASAKHMAPVLAMLMPVRTWCRGGAGSGTPARPRWGQPTKLVCTVTDGDGNPFRYNQSPSVFAAAQRRRATARATVGRRGVWRRTLAEPS